MDLDLDARACDDEGLDVDVDAMRTSARDAVNARAEADIVRACVRVTIASDVMQDQRHHELGLRAPSGRRLGARWRSDGKRLIRYYCMYNG